MSERIKEASIHLQLLVVGTILFLGVLFWPALDVNHVWEDWETARCILHSLWLTGAYLGFVVLVTGHALFRNRPEPAQESDQPARPE